MSGGSILISLLVDSPIPSAYTEYASTPLIRNTYPKHTRETDL